MNIAPCAKFSTPKVPRMMLNPLAISASKLPSATPLKACDKNCARVGMPNLKDRPRGVGKDLATAAAADNDKRPRASGAVRDRDRAGSADQVLMSGILQAVSGIGGSTCSP